MLSSELQLSDISVSSEIQTSLSFASFSFLCQSGLRVAHLRTLKLMKNQSGSQKEKVCFKLCFSGLEHCQKNFQNWFGWMRW